MVLYRRRWRGCCRRSCLNNKLTPELSAVRFRLMSLLCKGHSKESYAELDWILRYFGSCTANSFRLGEVRLGVSMRACYVSLHVALLCELAQVIYFEL